MEIGIKTLRREDWSRILRRAYAQMPVETVALKGMCSLIRIDEVTKPLRVNVLEEEYTIVDKDYHWLQIAPRGANWWLTVMFDEKKNVVQYYFDVTLENHITEEPWFKDLFLDVVLLTDGRIVLLDEDELDEALAEGTIDEEMHSLAQRTANMLMQALETRAGELEAFCKKLFAQLCEML